MDKIKRLFGFKHTQKFSFTKSLLSLLVLVFVLGFFVFAFGQKGEMTEGQKITKNVFESFSKVTSFSYKGEVNTEIYLKNEDGTKSFLDVPKEAGFNMNFSGKLNLEDLNNIENEASVFLNAGSPNTLQGFDMDLKGNKDFFYFNFKTIDLGIEIPAVDEFKNKWVSVPTDFLKNQLSGTYTLEDKGFSVVKKNSLKNAFFKAKIFDLTNKENTKFEGETELLGFDFKIDNNELQKFVLEIDKILDKRILGDAQGQEILEIIKNGKMPEGEIWLEKDTLLPREIIFGYDLEETDKYQAKMTFKINLEGFNEKIEIVFPEDYVDIEEVFKAFNMPMDILEE